MGTTHPPENRKPPLGKRIQPSPVRGRFFVSQLPQPLFLIHPKNKPSMKKLTSTQTQSINGGGDGANPNRLSLN